jgi:hypothetical protein
MRMAGVDTTASGVSPLSHHLCCYRIILEGGLRSEQVVNGG